MITHTEIPAVRHLVWQLDIAVAQRLFRQIRFIQQLAVYIDITIFVDIHPLARTGDTPLHQNFVPQIKGHQVARFEIGALHGNHDVAFFQSRRHGRTIGLQHRHPDGSHQNCHGSNYNQRIDGAPQYAEVP